ncbi:ABC transporter permease [Citricoccus sp. GCM10030269]|uniref:ABC transporter permease n=1 Tax=Citricoccus sp. GCM10030269 TaxID=3273388 RepID=UPI00361EB123
MSSSRWGKLLPWVGAPLLVILLCVVWEISVRALEVSTLILPPPSMIAERLGELIQDPEVWSHAGITATEIIFGFLLAVLFGVIVGVLLGKIAWLEMTVRPIIVLLQVVPKVAFVPLFVIWFGFGMSSKVIIAAMLAFFPIMLNVLLGVKSIDPGHRDVMTALNAGNRQRFTNLDFRSVMPYLLAGMETGIVFAVIGAIVGEYLGGNEGLGYMVVRTLNQLDAPGLFGVVVLLAVLGLLLYGAVFALKRFLIPWHESVYSQQGTVA